MNIQGATPENNRATPENNNSLQPPIGMCGCGKTFVKIPAHKAYCGVRCSTQAAVKRRAEKLRTENATVGTGQGQKLNWKPTVEMLREAERVLVAMNGALDGKTFHGGGEVAREWQPTDPRVMWSEATEPGTWNMVWVG